MTDHAGLSWVCQQCATEIEEPFDACWFCGATRDASVVSATRTAEARTPDEETAPIRGARCHACQYELADLPAGRCPECGRPFDPSVPGSVQIPRSMVRTYDLYRSGDRLLVLPMGFNWMAFLCPIVWACGRGLWVHAWVFAGALVLILNLVSTVEILIGPWADKWPMRLGVAMGIGGMCIAGRHGNAWCAARVRRAGFRLEQSVTVEALPESALPDASRARGIAGVLMIVPALALVFWLHGRVTDRAAARDIAARHVDRMESDRAAIDNAVRLMPDDLALQYAQVRFAQLMGVESKDAVAHLTVLHLVQQATIDKDRAMEYLDEAIRVDPQCGSALLARSRIHTSTDAWALALADLDSAIACGIDDSTTSFERARLLHQLDRDDDARQAYRHLMGMTGDVRTSLLFDGASDHVQFPGLPFDEFDEFTIEAWILGWRGTILLQGPSGDPVNSIWFGLPHTGWESKRGKNHEFRIPDGPQTRWTHVALVADGTRQRCYVDGVSVRSRVVPMPGPIRTSDALFIGSWSTAGDGKGRMKDGEGMLAELRISRSARYLAPFEPPRHLDADAETVLLLNSDSPDGARLLDQSDRAHHGTVNGPTWLKAEGAIDGGS